MVYLVKPCEASSTSSISMCSWFLYLWKNQLPILSLNLLRHDAKHGPQSAACRATVKREK